MTRDLVIAGALVALVALAFYGPLGGHAAPPLGSDGASNLTGTINPRVTQNNIQTTICVRGSPWPRPTCGALARPTMAFSSRPTPRSLLRAAHNWWCSRLRDRTGAGATERGAVRLRRALVLAGAQAQFVSLSKADDAQTRR
jgi:hypothetical protein